MDTYFIEHEDLKKRPALPDGPFVYDPAGIVATIERLRLPVVGVVR